MANYLLDPNYQDGPVGGALSPTSNFLGLTGINSAADYGYIPPFPDTYNPANERVPVEPYRSSYPLRPINPEVPPYARQQLGATPWWMPSSPNQTTGLPLTVVNDPGAVQNMSQQNSQSPLDALRGPMNAPSGGSGQPAGNWSTPPGDFTPNPTYPAVDLTQPQQPPNPKDFLSSQLGNNDFGGNTLRMPQPAPGPMQNNQQQPIIGNSDAGMWGLLAAGLGILAGSQGSYGSWAGPIGKGGLLGVKTYLDQRQQNVENAAQQQRLALANRAQNATEGNYQSEAALRNQQIAKSQQDMADHAALEQATQKYLSGLPAGTDVGKIMADPNTHYALARAIGGMSPGAAQMAMKDAIDLSKLDQANWETKDVTVGGDMTLTRLYNKKTSEWRDIPGAQPSHKQPVVAMIQEKAYESKKGGNLAEMQDALQKSAMSSYQDMAKFQRLGDLLGQVNTGKYKGTTTDIKAAAKSSGIDLTAMGITDDVAPAQAARALSQSIALTLRNPNLGGGMPGSLSNSDRDFLAQMTPNIENDPNAWPLILDTYKKLSQRNVEVAALARKYEKEHGQLEYAFLDELSKYSEAHPLFTSKSTGGNSSSQTPTSKPWERNWSK